MAAMLGKFDAHVIVQCSGVDDVRVVGSRGR